MRRTKPNDRFDLEQTRRRTRFASSKPNENFLSLPPQRFQVSLILFCSFKVLTEGNLFFIFHSHYLFAIGLSQLFSLRRSLPPTQSCSPEQLDSSSGHLAFFRHRTGLSPSLAVHSKTLGRQKNQSATTLQITMHEPEGLRFSSWAISGSLAVTEEIIVIFFYLRLVICLSSARALA